MDVVVAPRYALRGYHGANWLPPKCARVPDRCEKIGARRVFQMDFDGQKEHLVIS